MDSTRPSKAIISKIKAGNTFPAWSLRGRRSWNINVI